MNRNFILKEFYYISIVQSFIRSFKELKSKVTNISFACI